jgi:membrane associated rhomboid family serine protease
MLNVPAVVTVTLVVMGLVHAVRVWLLSPRADLELLKFFSFVPARYELAAQCGVPSGFAVDSWTFVSYALIHGDVTHLGVNAVWFLAFGSAVVRSGCGGRRTRMPIMSRPHRCSLPSPTRVFSPSWWCGSL